MSTTGLFDVREKVVLVTGGSRGLGRTMALAFGERGAKLAIASRKLDRCQAVVKEIEASGGEAIALACHVGDWDSLEVVVDTVCEHFGRIDVLINNAGMSPLAPSLLSTSETLFDKIIAVNLKGPTRLTALVAARMAETGGGSIINISSLAADKPMPLTTVYSAAKAGLNALTLASAQEFAGCNVRVNGIVCGTFDTDILAGVLSDPKLVDEVVKPIALGRVGKPEEIVGAVLYFASEASSYATGTLMRLDGGMPP